MLQQLLLDLGPQLTQLSLGASQNRVASQLEDRVHYSLSAPPRGMSALQSLTCNLGCSLDVDTDLKDAAAMSSLQVGPWQGPAAAAGFEAAAAAAVPAAAATVAAAGAVAFGNSSSSHCGSGVGGVRGFKAPPATIFASLTRLVLVDPACVPDVLQQLASSEAACSQLQHLEIPALAYSDEPAPVAQPHLQQRQDPAVGTLQELGKLQGLRELRADIAGQQQLDALVAAVGSQLLGLTVTCQKCDPLYLPPWDDMSLDDSSAVQLQPLLRGMHQLTSLEIMCSTGVELDTQQDLPVAAEHMTALKQFSYVGRIHSVAS